MTPPGDPSPPVAPSAAAAIAASAAAVDASEPAERTAPAPAVIARWIAVRSAASTSVGGPWRGRAVVGGSSPAARRPVMSSAIRDANTRPSSSELDASRLAPCTPVQDTSPHA